MRARYFKRELFKDPAWDILLDLYVARADGRGISVSSACIASGAPGRHPAILTQSSSAET
jgi:hypothetical protein